MEALTIPRDSLGTSEIAEPAPILAERLGIHQARAAQWVRAAGASYTGYVELRIAVSSVTFRKRPYGTRTCG